MIKKLEKFALNSYYGEDIETLYLPKDKSEKALGIKDTEVDRDKILSEDRNYALVFRIYDDLANDYYRPYFNHYVITYKECYHANCPKAQETFALLASCDYLNLFFDYQFTKMGKITKTSDWKMIIPFHRLILAGWWDEVKEILSFIMPDIYEKDSKKTIYLDKDFYIPMKMFWFILRLTAKAFEYELDDSYYPLLDSKSKEWEVYSNTVDIWDSKDLNKVNQHIFLLCELYLIDGMDNESSKSGTDDYLCEADIYVSPYPVLVWLRLREYKGLENPKEFTHPLMSHPFAVQFEGSLEKPKEIPFLNELVEFIEKKEPNMDFPYTFMKSCGMTIEPISERKILK